MAATAEDAQGTDQILVKDEHRCKICMGLMIEPVSVVVVVVVVAGVGMGMGVGVVGRVPLCR